MSGKIYQLSYDSNLDQDIDKWLNSLPQSRKAELVRNAIRYYLNATDSSIAPKQVNENKKSIKSKQNVPIYDIESLVKKQTEILEWFKTMPEDIDIDLSVDLLKPYNYLLNKPAKKKTRLLLKMGFTGVIWSSRKNGNITIHYIDGNTNEISSIFDYAYHLYSTTNQDDADTVLNELSRSHTVLCMNEEENEIYEKLILFNISKYFDNEFRKFFHEGFTSESYNRIKSKSSGIYALFDKQYNLVYVGKAKSLKDRVRSHIKGVTHTKDFYEEFEYIAVIYVSNYEDEADVIEKDLIRNYSPKKNKVHAYDFNMRPENYLEG